MWGLLPAIQHSSHGSPWGEERKSCRFKWTQVAQGSCPVQRGPWSLLPPAQLRGYSGVEGGVPNPALTFSPSQRQQGVLFRNRLKGLLLIPVSVTLMQQVTIRGGYFCDWSAMLTREKKNMHFRLSAGEVSLDFLPRRVLTARALLQLINAFLKALNKRKVLLEIAWGTLTPQVCIFCSRIPVPC